MLNFTNKKIVFVINSLEGGGAEKVLCNWLKEMEDIFTNAACEVVLLLLDSCVEKNSPPSYVTKFTLNAQGSIMASYRQTKKSLQALKPDLVFSFLTRSNIVAIACCNKMNIPVIASERVHTTNHFGSSLKGLFSRGLVRLFYPKATHLLAVSEGVKHDLATSYGVKNDNCEVIYNAYDAEKLEGFARESSNSVALDENAGFVVAIGRLVQNKNFEMLIRAYVESGITYKLLILGEGPKRKELESLISELKSDEKVELLGYADNPYPYLKQAAFLASSSTAEGFPNGIAEAICLGTPVLSTNCESGPAEIIADNYDFKTASYATFDCGVLVKNDCQTSFSKALSEMVTLVENKKFTSEKLKHRASLYSFNNVREILVRQMNELLGD